MYLYLPTLMAVREYVEPRRPCIIEGSLPLANFQQWTLEYLKQQAGHVAVEVDGVSKGNSS
jgi:hypothetical protein